MGCDVAIVVLHYENVNDTQECLMSLQKYLNKNQVQIIVVDNGSKLGKLDSLGSEYLEDKRVTFLRSDQNLGFAKGNNIGYQYAKEHLRPRIIVLANNDLVFSQDDFIERLIEDEKRTRFDIAGPKIVSLIDGKNQNPVGLVYHDYKEVNKRIKKFQILYFLSKMNLDLPFKQLFSKETPQEGYDALRDYQLHGACIIFANAYLSKHDGLYDGTFMYGEEFILKYIAMSESLKMIYLDDIEVEHKEGASTKAFFEKGKARRQFFYRWSIDSFKQLSKMMKDGR